MAKGDGDLDHKTKISPCICISKIWDAWMVPCLTLNQKWNAGFL